MVKNILFNLYKDVLIEVRLDSVNQVPVVWDDGAEAFSLYIKPRLHTKGILGETLLQSVPAVKLKWKSGTSKFTVQALFNKSEIFLSEVEIKEHSSRINNSSRGSTNTGGYAALHANDDTKAGVHDFLVSQFYLAGEMCLGRNYSVISLMENSYTYEMLVIILKNGISESLRGAAAYFLRYLYIDREPQSEVKVPRLTRTLTELTKADYREIVSAPLAEVGKFALVQYLVSTHLQSVKGKPFPVHTHSMLGILHSLIDFNFYGDIEQLKEVIDSLVINLKRDEYDISASSDGSGLPSSMKKLSVSSRASSRRVKSYKAGVTITHSPSVIGSDDSMSNITIAETKKRVKPWFSPADLFNESTPAKVLAFIESKKFMVFIIYFTLIASGITIYEIVDQAYFHGTEIFEIIVFSVYVLEVVLHFLLHVVVRKNVPSFFEDIFNILDLIVVLISGMVFLPKDQHVHVYPKFAKFLKLVMLFKFFNMANDEKKDVSAQEVTSNWTMPLRYTKSGEYTLKAMEKISRILYSVQMNIEDRKLSLFLEKFAADLEKGKGISHPKEAFEEIFEKAASLATSNEVYDHIYIDMLMYNRPNLVQSVLDLLMTHHASRRLLLENISKMQLITSDNDEKKFRRLEKIVSSLKTQADTHEIWGKLETQEHREVSSNMHRYLMELTDHCKKTREVLHFDESFEPVTFIQNILRNLGCFDVCMKIVSRILSIESDDTQENHVNTRNLALSSNRLLYWMVLDNPANQALAYEQLKFFMRTIDEQIESHLTISAIFRNNIELMEKVPKKYISEFIEMICKVGHFPQYLTLMSSIINVGEKNVITNQYEVIKLISSPEIQKSVVQVFAPSNPADYQKKIRLMSHYLNVKDISVNELPAELAYPLELMKLLSSCTIGRSGMTTIEAKVQSMYSFVDIIEAILDPNCLLLAKIRMGLFLYNAVGDVETNLPAFKDAACVWRLLSYSLDIFAFAKDDLRQIEKNGWDAASSSRQRIEFMLVCVMNVMAYFTFYYDYTIFKPEVGQTAVGVERIQLKEVQGNEIIATLFQRIFAIYEMLSPLLARDHHDLLFRTLCVLNDASKDKIVAQVENIHDPFFSSAQEYIKEEIDATGALYDKFINELKENEDIQASADNQAQSFVSTLENLPWLSNPVEKVDVRFEPLIEKLVAHIRGCLEVITHGEDTVKYMSTQATKTSIWLLKIFRSMIEKRWGMTIYERDDDGGEEQDEAVEDLMEVYNQSGMTELCLDLIARGLDVSLQSEALKLLVGMLFKEGGALPIQKSIYNHLAEPGSHMFFMTVRQILRNLMSWHQWNGVVLLPPDVEPKLPDEIIIVRCLQLMCEGHFRPNQDILREQPLNNISINLLDDCVAYLQCVDSIKCRTSTASELAISSLILEVIQGPCEGNQDYFALNTELIETLNRKLRQHPVNDCDETQEMELKKAAIDILQALLEGQGRKTSVYERMLSVIHVDVILVLCRGQLSEEEFENNFVKGSKDIEESDESIALRTESLVLLQMLTDFRPMLKKELGLDDDLSTIFKDSVACIEVVWRGELQRRFFHIPDICLLYLSKSTKDNFILHVNRVSQEGKLYGLLEAAKDMYREVLHQQLLKDYRLNLFFSRTNQNLATWFNFSVALIINLLFIIFYVSRTVALPCLQTPGVFSTALPFAFQNSTTGLYAVEYCTDITLNQPEVSVVILVLTIILILGATFTLLSSLIVRAPVNFQANMEKNFGVPKSLFYCLLDFSTLHYFFYLVISLVGIVYHPAISLLLLDFITMSPTTQAVLSAVYIPRKQITMTIVLICIIIYVFAMFEVSHSIFLLPFKQRLERADP